MNISLKDLKSLTYSNILNEKLFRLKKITGVSSDSRTVHEGNIFFAIRGEHHDGHNFINHAHKEKVTAIVVDKEWYHYPLNTVKPSLVTIVVVPDTTKALGELANIYRRKFNIPIIAVAGSNGKTTTKDMIASVLQTTYNVLCTQGNLNNHIGLPHMLFRLRKGIQIAVLELGTNHHGEIDYLCSIAEPNYGVVTNIGKEHLEFFSNLSGVAKEETSIYKYLNGRGTVFINSDEPFLMKATTTNKNKIYYSINKKTDFYASDIELNKRGEASFILKSKKKRIKIPISLNVPGKHNITNALVAGAVGVVFNVPKEKISIGLSKFTSPSKRLEVIHRHGLIVLNDTYNANPDSVMVALETLKNIIAPGKKIIVMADMLELGVASKKEHTLIGKKIKSMKFKYLFTYGTMAQHINNSAKLENNIHFDSKNDLKDLLSDIVNRGDVVLVKGSRGMRMEEIVDHLQEVG
ncbi:MAG: UDP-N-acetylmuramoyl-tripeptide--D-alanyl-D-alanine ligase [Ignavibacteria bacterium]|nr:UDP-N-acetylmuramoyl-tripeptide--D-alanyl-D-alanine ligase [Bacteroidota bacterium]MSQ46468.1 UDP-N-acetylmuramoyl-tripeptide--D-alanyl-D-alanine ligase [Ignavibacteria bacterium]